MINLKLENGLQILMKITIIPRITRLEKATVEMMFLYE
jgi:hypothetical protein